jgi:hypothetical protein
MLSNGMSNRISMRPRGLIHNLLLTSAEQDKTGRDYTRCRACAAQGLPPAFRKM